MAAKATEKREAEDKPQPITLEACEFFALYTLLAEAAEHRLPCHSAILEAAGQGKAALSEVLQSLYEQVMKERAIKRAVEARRRKAVAMYQRAWGELNE